MKDQLHQDRRSFLKTLGGTTAISAAVPVLLHQQRAAAAPAAAGLINLASSQGRVALEIDNIFAGWLTSAEGGHTVGRVFTELFGPGKFMRKHVSGASFEDIVISLDTLSPALLNVVQRNLNLEKVRISGAIVSVGDRSQVVSRLSFHDALITEIGFPALDAGSQDAAKMTLKLVPEYAQRLPGSGVVAFPPPVITAQRRWLASNFRLAIEGLDCSRVNRIDALTVRHIPYPDEAGPGHGPATAVEFPNLVITVPEYFAPDFYKWHEDFVLNASGKEKAGTLSWLDASGNNLGTLTLKGLGVFKVAPVKVEAGTDGVRRVRAEMYCEEINVKSTGAPGPQ